MTICSDVDIGGVVNPKRFFLAFFPEPGNLNNIEANQRSAAKHFSGSPARWESSQRFHLTLHFLGDFAPDSVVGALEQAGSQTGSLRGGELILGNWVCFPSLSKARVLGLGPAPIPSWLSELHRQTGDALVAQGAVLENRVFSPHLTLARFRTPVSAHQLSTPLPIPIRCRSLFLMQSESGQSHKSPVYKRIREFALAG